MLSVSVCPGGFQRGISAPCEACAQGTFRSFGQQSFCTDCPAGWTTSGRAAVSCTQGNTVYFLNLIIQKSRKSECLFFVNYIFE